MLKGQTLGGGGDPGADKPATAEVDKNTPEGVFAGIKPLITEDVVNQMRGTFLFELSGSNAGFCCWIYTILFTFLTICPCVNNGTCDANNNAFARKASQAVESELAILDLASIDMPHCIIE